MEARQNEWGQLRALAGGYLENSSVIPSAADLSKCFRILRLWVLPSFEQHASWGVFQCGRPGKRRLLVRRITWDQQSDAERLLVNPMQGLKEGLHVNPTINVCDRSIDSNVFGEYMEKIKTIYLPVGLGLGVAGIDGTNCGVEITSGRVLVEWWSCHALEWQPLVSWCEEIIAWLNTVCDMPELTG